MKKGNMKIVLAPINGVGKDNETNIITIRECCKQAVSREADLIAFPELALTGGDTQALEMDIYSKASEADGAFTKEIAHIAKCTGLYIAVGFPQKSKVPGRLYSTYLLCAPNGQKKTLYQKCYFDDLDQLYMTGSSKKNAVVTKLPFGTVTYALGADIETPEFMETIRATSPNLILAASAGTKRRNSLDLARQCNTSVAYVAEGYGCISNPDGSVITSHTDEQLIETELELC